MSDVRRSRRTMLGVSIAEIFGTTTGVRARATRPEKPSPRRTRVSSETSRSMPTEARTTSSDVSTSRRSTVASSACNATRNPSDSV